MLFKDYRIDRLRRRVEVQRGYADVLKPLAEESGTSYYADRYINEHLKWLDLNSKLKFWEQSK